MGFHKALIGNDLHAPSRYGVINDTALTIPALLCVKFSGIGTNGQPSIVPCNPSDIVDGITEISMLANVADYVTSNGLLFNVNTAAWIVGTKLYCGAGGVLTDIPTTYSPVANVLRSNAVTGTLFIYLSGGSSSGGDPDFSQVFVVGDWVGPAIGFYTILFNHGLNAAMVEVEVWDASNAVVECDRLLTSVNEVTLRVPAVPDLRFDGKIWIKTK